MKIQDLNINLKSLHEPKTRQDVILLLQECCAEMDIINAHLAAQLKRAADAAALA